MLALARLRGDLSTRVLEADACMMPGFGDFGSSKPGKRSMDGRHRRALSRRSEDAFR
jgi:hypothetical protein